MYVFRVDGGNVTFFRIDDNNTTRYMLGEVTNSGGITWWSSDYFTQGHLCSSSQVLPGVSSQALPEKFFSSDEYFQALPKPHLDWFCINSVLSNDPPRERERERERERDLLMVI